MPKHSNKIQNIKQFLIFNHQTSGRIHPALIFEAAAKLKFIPKEIAFNRQIATSDLVGDESMRDLILGYLPPICPKALYETIDGLARLYPAMETFLKYWLADLHDLLVRFIHPVLHVKLSKVSLPKLAPQYINSLQLKSMILKALSVPADIVILPQMVSTQQRVSKYRCSSTSISKTQVTNAYLCQLKVYLIDCHEIIRLKQEVDALRKMCHEHLKVCCIWQVKFAIAGVNSKLSSIKLGQRHLGKNQWQCLGEFV
ncbi:MULTISPECIES: hypothetical protein [Cysteiniphilum]|uniref:Uncharacterized protein n=1 Tax=Cysteiniphilum litorale TaxID=2056700 RepID=A0A8J3E811_9GAMM|nr:MULTISPECIES: hypothetical protein [Cysteiniphilum]GGF90891.1 hypothetical protein GCM10010995_05220 [Cysteiniphilum litorale]